MSASDNTANVQRRFDVAPEIVFSAFADPELVARWLRPSLEVRLEVLVYEFRIGGRYRFAYHVPDLGVMHVNGVFKAIERPSRIAFSWNIEPPDEHAGIASDVHVAIIADGAGTEVSIRHVKLSRPGARDRHAKGWLGALTNLALMLGEEGAHGR